MVNEHLDSGGVLYATQDDLEAAIRIVLAKEENPDYSALFPRRPRVDSEVLAVATNLAAALAEAVPVAG